MANSAAQVLALPPDQVAALQALLVEFDRHWRDGRGLYSVNVFRPA